MAALMVQSSVACRTSSVVHSSLGQNSASAGRSRPLVPAADLSNRLVRHESNPVSSLGCQWLPRRTEAGCSRGRVQCRGAAAEGDKEADQSGDGQDKDDSSTSSEEFRARMEALVENQGKDEAYFDGKELARLIFDKFGRSYDVTFMRQEFMGRKLLAMNIMWKYREQKSFPLSEAEYLTRLDLVAENLRFWGAVGLVRESLAATKERPRIGKAVSIRIDLDETGERSREWINR